MIENNIIRLTENFSLHEFVCKDGLGSFRLTRDFCNMVLIVQKTRTALGVALRINSSYRTPKYNKKVGGGDGSSHLKNAIDITYKNRRLRTKKNLILLALLLKYFGMKAADPHPKKKYVHGDNGRPRPIY